MSKKLIASGMSKTREDVNQGPNQGSGRKSGGAKGHGQDSDNRAEHDKLVGWTMEQQDPYRASGNDFPDGHKVNAAHGQSTGAEKLNNETAEKNRLATYSMNQESPRRNEDGCTDAASSGSPVPADRAAVVSRNFPISQNSGESSASGGQIPIVTSVNLMTGYLECSGSRTRVQEVPEDKVTIG